MTLHYVYRFNWVFNIAHRSYQFDCCYSLNDKLGEQFAFRSNQFAIHTRFGSINEDIGVVFGYFMSQKILDELAGFSGSNLVPRNDLGWVDFQLDEFIGSLE